MISRMPSEGCREGRVGGSDADIGLDPLKAVAGEREVRLGTVEDQVQEQALAARGPLEQPDQVVLLAEGDKYVLDGVVESKRLHRPDLRADDLGIAGRRDVEVQVLAAAHSAERHSAFPVHQARAKSAIYGHGFLQSYINGHLFLPLKNAGLAGSRLAKDKFSQLLS